MEESKPADDKSGFFIGGLAALGLAGVAGYLYNKNKLNDRAALRQGKRDARRHLSAAALSAKSTATTATTVTASPSLPSNIITPAPISTTSALCTAPAPHVAPDTKTSTVTAADTNAAVPAVAEKTTITKASATTITISSPVATASEVESVLDIAPSTPAHDDDDGDGEDQSSTRKSVELSRRANEHYARKEYKEAIALLSQAIALQENFKFYTNRALIYIHDKRYQEAYEDSRTSVRLRPTPKGYYALGRSSMGLKRYEEAIAHFSSVHQYDEAEDSKRLAIRLAADCQQKVARKGARSSPRFPAFEDQSCMGSSLTTVAELAAAPRTPDPLMLGEGAATSLTAAADMTESGVLVSPRGSDSFCQSGILVDSPDTSAAGGQPTA